MGVKKTNVVSFCKTDIGDDSVHRPPFPPDLLLHLLDPLVNPVGGEGQWGASAAAFMGEGATDAPWMLTQAAIPQIKEAGRSRGRIRIKRTAIALRKCHQFHSLHDRCGP